MATGARREFLISKGWIQAAVLVVLVGFFVLGLLAYRTYMEQPPVPGRVVGANGDVLFTGEDISRGQQVFLHNGLMEYGSVFGHGAYLGPDYTADYLRRSSDLVRTSFGGARLRPGGAADDRGAAHQPLRRGRRHADLHGATGGRLPPARPLLQRLLLRPDDPARAAPGRDHRPRPSCGS